jgi:hypothetical protein
MDYVFEHNEIFPRIVSPSSLCFTYPTRVADAWEPYGEKVVEDESVIPETRFFVKMFKGSTRELSLRNWIRKYDLPRRLQSLREPLSMDGVLYDGRYASDLENVTHFLCGTLTQVLHARRILRIENHGVGALRVVLPAKAPKFACEMLDLLNIPYILTDRKLRGTVLSVGKTGLASGKDIQHYPIPSLFDDKSLDSDDTPERVFISRKISRRITNESEVEELLAKERFVKYYFEDLSVREQWGIMRNAEEIVAIHGAALGHLLVHHGWRTGDGPKVVEIFGAGHKTKCFRYYVAAVHGQWCAVRSKITSRIIRDMDENFKRHSHAWDAITVDAESVGLALEYVRQY